MWSRHALTLGAAGNVFFWLGTVPCRVVTIVGIVIETWQRENIMGFTGVLFKCP